MQGLNIPNPDKDTPNDDERRRFILQVVQPGLAGLMDGTVSSLATAVGAGISMAFSEALSDDGKISGRGSPWLRGVVEGFMTFLGAIGHALPFLIKKFETALIIASVVVAVELIAIA